MPKKVVASKRPRGSSSSEFDKTRFVSVEAETKFNDSITCRSGLKERGFDIDVENPKVEYFYRVIESRGWQFFCTHPKVASMIVVREFYASAAENTSNLMVFVKGK